MILILTINAANYTDQGDSIRRIANIRVSIFNELYNHDGHLILFWSDPTLSNTYKLIKY